ncbi:pantoate--beta-alanine ligase [Porphyromonas circumdentaria]|uniref:Pantothenate synthetase n=1 Tax=Porphyromonas circumdentaria TaxID=29524 RepID=A0A1T4LAQ9_9PORP|nr:pantoate--beta-alanine ligase [Porphyromonas circumdentaria]MBB6275332.1 pantoate--beta-alanine ligase [Porphyromonas circumdentaria]MDO4722804.1 pantoate--beta-alanine ligase [Porphyromonas circumdentaria]SJZ51872.1 pantothenate synthetase [Porphyromonas circumdentaria]
MKTIATKKELISLLDTERELGKSIGLVPTMGALHEGHLSLVKEAVKRYDICVVSIFVNPKQFNNPQDLITYPRQPEQDIALLEKAGCHYLFMPTEEEVYEEGAVEKVFHFGSIANVMEGVQRPGHFEGVALIVSKLFELVRPHGAFFGEKDYQQIAIIRSMVQQCAFDLDIIAMPIVRESTGLALSSRNQRLTEETRPYAPMIYQKLRESLDWKKGGKTPREIEQKVTEELNAHPCLDVEYYMIVDATTLQPITSWSDAPATIGCIACYCGEVRLIDNISYP